MARPVRLLAALLCLALLGLPLGACGDDGPEGTEPAADREEPGRPTTKALLAGLAARVKDGRGISDQTWTMDVQEVGMALWPGEASAANLAFRRAHTNLSHIAGDLARRLADDPGVREALIEQDPVELSIHDSFVEQSAAGAEAYRAWVETKGRALLEERLKRLTGDRPPR